MKRSHHDLDEMKRLVEEHYDAAVNNQDLSRLDDQLTTDFIDHGLPPGAPHGPGPVKEWLAQLKRSFPDLTVRPEQIVAEGDVVAVRATWSGTHAAPFMGVPATGREIQFSGAVFWRVESGRLAERWAYLDRAALLEELKAETSHD